MRVIKEKDGRGWLFRFFSANWSEVAWARIGASGPAVEVAFPSDWSEHKMGWVRLGFGLGKLSFAFPWPWVSKDDGQCSGHTYGFVFFENALHLHWGKQRGKRGDPFTVIDIPWQNWRFIRQSWYGPDGQEIETLWETSDREVKRAQWEWRREFEKSLEKTRFEIEDFDGQRIGVSTNIEEREWRFGTGLFSWLSLFRKHRIRRALAIEFDKEVGTQKGSWKGGLIGTSIEMLPGELHEAALRRYCEQEHRDKGGRYRIKLIGAA